MPNDHRRVCQPLYTAPRNRIMREGAFRKHHLLLGVHVVFHFHWNLLRGQFSWTGVASWLIQCRRRRYLNLFAEIRGSFFLLDPPQKLAAVG